MAGRLAFLQLSVLLVFLFGGCYCHEQTEEIVHQFRDTWNGIHYFLVFDTPLVEDFVNGKLTDVKQYSFIWGASEGLTNMYRNSNPYIVLSKYMPWCRDPLNHDLAWWKANHPDWVVYNCDGVTPAGLATDPQIVLDVSNPDVIDWQIENIVQPALDWGYDAIAADNFALGNANAACGVWKNNKFTQRYNGLWWDAVYTGDVLNWLAAFKARLAALRKPMKLGVNFVIMGMDPMDPYVSAVTADVDMVVDEAGFTNWGEGLADEVRWLNILNYTTILQAAGKSYFGIHQFANFDDAAKEFAVASYLMSKNHAAGLAPSGIQWYGRPNDIPEFDALNVGHPTGNMFKSQGAYWRTYSGGLAIVNPTATATTVTISGDTTYVDIYNKEYPPAATIFMNNGTGLVLGIKGQTTTTSTTYDDWYTTVTVDATTGQDTTTQTAGSTTSTVSSTTKGTSSATSKATSSTSGGDDGSSGRAQVDPSDSAEEGGDPVTNSATTTTPTKNYYTIVVLLVVVFGCIVV